MSLIKKAILAGALALGLSSLEQRVNAQAVVPEIQQVIPGAASAPGKEGSLWKTDVHATSHATTNTALTTCYLPNNTEPVCVTDTIRPGETKAYKDMVQTTFQRPGTAGAITFSSNQDPSLLEVSAETYNLNTTTGGTLGIGITPATTTNNGDIAGMLGPSDITSFRANIDFGTLNNRAVITSSLYDKWDNLLSTKTETLEPFKSKKSALFEYFGVTPQEDTYIETQTTEGSGTYAFITVIDNTSNSSTYHPSRIVQTVAGRSAVPTDQFLTSTVTSQGVAGAVWRTDVIARNADRSSNATMRTDMLAANRDNTTPIAVAQPLFYNGETRHFDDVLQTELGLPAPSVGGLRLHTGQFIVQERVYTATSTGGTVGGSILPQTKYEGAIAKSGLPDDAQPVTDLSVNGIYDNNDPAKGPLRRTNTILLNTSKSDINDTLIPANVTITLYNSDGTQLGTPYKTTLQALEQKQENSLARRIAGTDVINGRYTIHLDNDTDTASGVRPSVLALTTTIDNITNNFTAKTGHQITIPDATPTIYEMKSDIFVVTSAGQLLATSGTTRDERFMKLFLGSDSLNDRLVGLYVQDNNNSQYLTLQTLIEKIRTNFSPADYRAVFNEEYSVLLPFLTDTDGDGLCIDILPNRQDWSYDNNTSTSGNNLQGTTRIQWSITKVQ